MEAERLVELRPSGQLGAEHGRAGEALVG
jgi:hypothetical protein